MTINFNFLCLLSIAFLIFSCNENNKKTTTDDFDVYTFLKDHYKNLQVLNLNDVNILEKKIYTMESNLTENCLTLKLDNTLTNNSENWIFSDPKSDDYPDRNLDYWDSFVKPLQEQPDPYGLTELFKLYPESIKIIRISSEKFVAYVILNNDGTTNGIFWIKEINFSFLFKKNSSINNEDYSVFKYINDNFEEVHKNLLILPRC